MLLNQHANVIANVTTPVALVMTEIEDHVKMKLISQLISNISKFLQNYSSTLMVLLFQHYLYYHHYDIILNMKDSKTGIAAFGSSLSYSHKLQVVFDN